VDDDLHLDPNRFGRTGIPSASGVATTRLGAPACHPDASVTLWHVPHLWQQSRDGTRDKQSISVGGWVRVGVQFTFELWVTVRRFIGTNPDRQHAHAPVGDA
jgi:hypothetical protein